MLKLSSLSFAFALVIGTGAVAFFNQIIATRALSTLAAMVECMKLTRG
jgi:hypothetical protein